MKGDYGHMLFNQRPFNLFIDFMLRWVYDFYTFALVGHFKPCCSNDVHVNYDVRSVFPFSLNRRREVLPVLRSCSVTKDPSRTPIFSPGFFPLNHVYSQCNVVQITCKSSLI